MGNSRQFNDYPVRVTLCFKNEDERDYFLGQLSDGWGENVCSLKWDGRRNLYTAPLVAVDPWHEEGRG